MKPYSVTGLIIKDNKILSIARKDNPNDFGLPGGKIDKGELPYIVSEKIIVDFRVRRC